MIRSTHASEPIFNSVLTAGVAMELPMKMDSNIVQNDEQRSHSYKPPLTGWSPGWGAPGRGWWRTRRQAESAPRATACTLRRTWGRNEASLISAHYFQIPGHKLIILIHALSLVPYRTINVSRANQTNHTLPPEYLSVGLEEPRNSWSTDTTGARSRAEVFLRATMALAAS